MGIPIILTRIRRKMRKWIQRKKKSEKNIKSCSTSIYMNFEKSEENYIRIGAQVLEESISLFHGKTNPIRHFSVDELNNMNVKRQEYYKGASYNLHQGSWEGREALVNTCPNLPSSTGVSEYVREIVVATKMATHNNVHKLLGCCLETTSPILVYESVEANSLEDCVILKDGNQNKKLLEWKDRLRIAWEISHAVAYLHTAFPRPIIHRDLKPYSVLLDENNSAKLCNFTLSISLPEGQEFVEDSLVIGTWGYIDPSYMQTYMVAESSDVYAFGVLLLVLLTGKRASIRNENKDDLFVEWVQGVIKDNIVREILDPSITKNGVTAIEDLQLRASIQLALFCIACERDSRPTMVEVATALKSMIASPESIPTITKFQLPDIFTYTKRRYSEEINDVEQEIGSPLEALTEQAHRSIISVNSVSFEDQTVDPGPNNMAMALRCKPRENVNNAILPHDHVSVAITSIIEVEENEPLRCHHLVTSWPGKSRLVIDQVRCGEKKAKRTNKDDLMDRRMQAKELLCLFSEQLQFLVSPELFKYLPYSCKELHDLMVLQPLGTCVAVGFSADIFQYHDTKEEFEAYVTTQNVVQLLSMQWLDTSCLQIFMRYLHNKCKLLEVGSIGFICPKRLAMVKEHLIFTSQYMQYAISELQSKSYVLAPYYQENHWTLIVVCPQRHDVLFFDPMGKNLDGVVIKGRINMAYRLCVQSERSPKRLTWRLVQCPRQVNEAECGYYVMRYMYEIITLDHQTHVNLEECFTSEPYTQQQINEVRDMWARYFIDECI